MNERAGLERAATLPARARVALALAAAGRALGALGARPEHDAAARRALADAWSWEESGAADADGLYERLQALIAMEPALEGAEPATAALHSVIEALYYATWHAERLEREAGRRSMPLPNDMAEADEADLAECLALARAAGDAEAEARWQAEGLDRLLDDFAGVEDRAVPRDYFASS